MDWREWDALRTAHSREWEPRLVYEAVIARKWWLIGPPLAAAVLIAGLLFLQAPRYSAEAQVLIGPRTAGMIGLRSSLALFGGESKVGPAAGQAQLIASRDLARRAIKDLHVEDNPEFDPAARGLGPISRALVFLGMLSDPYRRSLEDRVLEAYQDRLQVSAPGRGSLVTINFQSEDRELAAKAANRIAELYLELRADGNALPQNGGARIVSRAMAPRQPVYPSEAWLLVPGAAMLLMAFGAFVTIALPGGCVPGRQEKPLEQPRVLGQVRVFARISNPSRFNPGPGPELVPQPGRTDQVEDGGNQQVTAKIMARILSVPFDGFGARGMRIVATSPGPASAASAMLREFARDLALEGHSIVIDLGESRLFDEGRQAAGVLRGSAFAAGALPGFGDLLDGTASFAEVIHRDPASRLHFLPAGRAGERDHDALAPVLDALAGTYDFLLMIAPPLDQDGLAETLARKADFAVLAMPAGPQGGAVIKAEQRLIDAGAREVLIIGLPARSPRSLGRNAA